MRFEWDPEKEKLNRLKHHVPFTEACQIFADKNNLTIYDHSHSQNEDRWITLGRSLRGILIVAVHTYKTSGGVETVRIISARKASRREATQYFERDKS